MSTAARLTAALCVLLFAAGVAGCKSRTEKFCFDRKPVDYKTLTACGELCEKKHAKGCSRMADLGKKYCFDKKQVRFCDYMCFSAKSGKDLYCKERDRLQKQGKKLP